MEETGSVLRVKLLTQQTQDVLKTSYRRLLNVRDVLKTPHRRICVSWELILVVFVNLLILKEVTGRVLKVKPLSHLTFLVIFVNCNGGSSHKDSNTVEGSITLKRTCQ